MKKEKFILDEDSITDEEYLEQEFPKGKTKFRGQAMVLLALARQQGKQEVLRKVNKLIDEEIADEKEAMKNGTKRMEWTILKELNLVKMKLTEQTKGELKDKKNEQGEKE